MRKVVKDSLHDVALMTYGRLAGEGFAVADTATGEIAFRSAQRRLEVVLYYDDFEDYVSTSVVDTSAGVRRHAWLDDLYCASELGPPQDLKSKVLTRRSLEIALESQLAGFRRLLPVLAGSNRDLLPWRL
jgi:hypothetical protein